MSETQDALDALAAQVEQNTTLEGSVATLIQGLVNQINAIPGITPEVKDLTAKLAASAAVVAAAVPANTRPAAGP